MTDTEKVIKGLLCIKGDFIPCISCKYATAEGYGRGDKCKRECVSDAIALLKEKETKDQCLKTKCTICPHCDNCDVDENGNVRNCINEMCEIV